MTDKQIKILMNRLKVRTDQKFDQQIKSQGKRFTDQKYNQQIDQQIDSQINRLKVRSTDQKLNEQINSWINR